MSVIIYGPQGCGKTSNAVSLASYLGLTRIIDNGKDEDGAEWTPGMLVTRNTLVLTNIAGIDGALDFFSVKAELDAHNEQAKNDLSRDIVTFLAKKLGSEFSIAEVKSFLRISALDSRFSPLLDLMIGEVLIDAGCIPVSREYDRFNSWYLSPSRNGLNTELHDILEPFVGQQAADFTIEDVAEFLGLTGDMLTREVRVGISLTLCGDLGCHRIEKRNNAIRFWYRPPVREGIKAGLTE